MTMVRKDSTGRRTRTGKRGRKEKDKGGTNLNAAENREGEGRKNIFTISQLLRK